MEKVSVTKAKRTRIQVVSLFSGCGGMDRGFQSAGFDPVLAIDKDDAACESYQLNFPLVRVLRSNLATAPELYVTARLRELPTDVTPVGVIGGPPCQAFSLGNGRKKKNDPRALLSKNYANILSELNSEFELDFFVFENVVGLRHKQHEVQFQEFKDQFRSAGFRIFEEELNAVNFGVPQIRRRVFIVGLNRKKYPKLEFVFPARKARKQPCVGDSFEGIPAPTYFDRGLDPKDIPFHPNHWCMNPRSARFKNGSLKKSTIKGRPFRLLKTDSPSWTVAYGHREMHVHPDANRRVSVFEAMLLQGFPKKHVLMGTLSDQVRQVSDAVPPPLAKAIALAIRETLGYDDDE